MVPFAEDPRFWELSHVRAHVRLCLASLFLRFVFFFFLHCFDDVLDESPDQERFRHINVKYERANGKQKCERV